MCNTPGHHPQPLAAPFRPADFDAFWRETLDRLARIPYAIRADTPPDITSHLRLTTLQFQSWGGVQIQAYLLQQPNPEPRPLVVYTHGYNGQYEIVRHWAERGLDVFGFDTRGFGRSRNAVPERHPDGWILTGIEAPAHSILRGAICDYHRAVDVARQLLPRPPRHTLFYGFSFGGAMALVGAALRRDADMVVAGVPSLGWMAGRRRLVKAGSGKEVNDYLTRHPHLEQTVMQTLAYFDTANFAAQIRAPCLLGLGQRDIVVPAATVRAISERLRCAKILREFPVSHSQLAEERLWQDFEAEWLGRALTGDWPVTTGPIDSPGPDTAE
mgnify:CR=1 FL=1